MTRCGSRRSLARLRLDIALVIGVGHGFRAGEHLAVGDVRDEHGMRSEIQLLDDLAGEIGVGIFRDVEHPVLTAGGIRPVRELVRVLAAAETEVGEDVERSLLGEHGDIENSGFLYHVMRFVCLVHRDRDPVGCCGYLHRRVDDAAVVALTGSGGENKQAVGELVHCFIVH